MLNSLGKLPPPVLKRMIHSMVNAPVPGAKSALPGIDNLELVPARTSAPLNPLGGVQMTDGGGGPLLMVVPTIACMIAMLCYPINCHHRGQRH